MIKTTDFFLEKANEYKAAFTEVLANYIKDSSLGWNEDPKYTEQKKHIADLKLKTKLFFSEFDKGEIFIEEIEKVDKNVFELFDETKRILSYNRVLELFIDHLNTFRK